MQQILAVTTAATEMQRQQGDLQRRYDERTGEPQESPVLKRLDSYTENCWQAAKAAKERDIEPEMLADIRQRDGVYAPDKMAAIREQGGSEIYMMLTNVKARAAESWIRDILLPSGERTFTASPSPVPDDLPPNLKVDVYQRTLQELDQAVAQGLYPTPGEVKERARKLYDQVQARFNDIAEQRAKRMEDAIDDVFVQGQWYEAMGEMIGDLVCLPAAFIKGPVIQQQKNIRWDQDVTGQFVPMADGELTPTFYSPSPLDIYPAPNSRGIEDGYLLERLTLRRAAIYKMKGVPGYDSDAIDRALEDYQHSGHSENIAGEEVRRDLENSTSWSLSPDNTIDAMEFHGNVRGEWLIEWGVSEARIPDPAKEYDISCLKIGRYVVRCVLNTDPLGRKPYMMAHYDSIKNQFWGRGMVRLIRDLQDMCNATARAMVNNLSIASGPLVETEVDRLAEGEDVTQIYPWRVFQTKAATTNSPSPAIRFYQPDDNTDKLMEVYEYFSRLADNYSGIPRFEQGLNTTSGAAGTASGLAMLMNASSRQIKRVIASIDNMIVGSAERVHTYLMLYGAVQEIKGDVELRARGAASLVAREQLQVRRNQFLEATMNPMDAKILGIEGRAELLRQAVRTLDMDPDDGIIPTEDELRAKMKQMAAGQGPGAPEAGAQGGKPGQAGPNLENLDASGRGAGGVEASLFAGG